jgi:L-amino acid N-acyltransferase YncA
MDASLDETGRSEAMTSTYSIRSATGADASRIAEIYAPYVRDTPASFEIDPPRTQEMLGRIGAGARTYPWLVAEDGAAVVGYAYGGEFRRRAAYRWSAEVSVYIDMNRRSRGAGRALMNRLLDELRAGDFANAFAGVTLPNPASVRLFESLGFEPIGVFRNVGYKFGAWHDVGWWQLPLREIRSD